ncbi:DUF4252 domain-containing protein [Polaribacter aquimarinus]|uniref:DUF4252 domain-containing protein n=1 Tax=Polaribacter aquimarinus TaxID=2100726 RepID=A0A2U2J7W0_9FLAO|nr:DUF4252 domain-containing protein [Polaribacter aquimarinus]PWG04425.1 DUF4252 domain-containing protein [Polaribacter aquimarinus]
MRKITKILSLLLLVLMITSCKNEKSLQGYLVESQEKTGFITVDIPTSFLQLKSDDVSDEVKATLKSIRKVNVVALPIKGNETTYQVEKDKLKSIFKDNKDYKSLMSMKVKGMNIKLYYTGNTDSIDEVIAFGYNDKAGVGVARLLGDNMNPAKIIEMMNNIKVDADDINLGQFKAIFNSK